MKTSHYISGIHQATLNLKISLSNKNFGYLSIIVFSSASFNLEFLRCSLNFTPKEFELGFYKINQIIKIFKYPECISIQQPGMKHLKIQKSKL